MLRMIPVLSLFLLLLVACTQSNAAPPQSLGGGYPSGSIQVRYQGQVFVPDLGPVRADLLEVQRLMPTGLVLKDQVVEQGDDGSPVFQAPGMPLEEGFLVLFHSEDSPVSWIAGSAHPTCQPGAGAYVYTALGADPPPPPFGPVTPSAPYPGGPTPTPAPTPSVGPFPTELSADGLLSVGWPTVNLEPIQPEYQGVIYRYTSFRYINQRGADTSIPPAVLEELEVLDITYRVQADLPSPLNTLVTSDPVTDRVRVYRFKDRPASEVIVLNQCPVDFRGDQLLFYRVKQV